MTTEPQDNVPKTTEPPVNNLPVNPNIKPRTIPEALGISDRKAKAIYDTTIENVNRMSTIDALIDVQKTFADPDERFFAVYVLSRKLGAKDVKGIEEKAQKLAEEKVRRAIPQIANQVGQQAMQAGAIEVMSHIPELMAGLEKKGMIKILDPDLRKAIDEANGENTSIGTKEDGIPDEFLFGDAASDTAHESESETGTKDTKPKNDDISYARKNDEPERMYG